jgi:hypothetical protein
MSRRFAVLSVVVFAFVSVLIASKMSNDIPDNHSITLLGESLFFKVYEQDTTTKSLRWSTSKPLLPGTRIEEFISNVPLTARNVRLYAANGTLIWTLYRPVGGGSE